MPVVDASVWVSLHHSRDRFHRPCVRWLERVLLDGEELVAPTLLEVEVAAALRRLTGDEALARQAIDRAASLGILDLVPLTAERSRRAAALASSAAVRGADAVYLDLALERNDVLVTLDRQQLERGSRAVNVSRPRA